MKLETIIGPGGGVMATVILGAGVYAELKKVRMEIEREHDKAVVAARDSERRAEEFMNLARQKRAEAEAYKSALNRLEQIEVPK